MMGWQDQYDESAFEATGPLGTWVDFLAALIGAGGMLLVLHLLGLLTLFAQWAALLFALAR